MPRGFLALVTVFFLAAGPASAEILFVCGGKADAAADFSGSADLSRLLEPTRISTTADSNILDTQIALSEDARGYDVVVNWGEKSQRSLRDSGASITGTGFGTALVHLVVSRSEGAPLEHFIFSEDRNRLGELVWARGPSDAAAEEDTAEQRTLCVLP